MAPGRSIGPGATAVAPARQDAPDRLAAVSLATLGLVQGASWDWDERVAGYSVLRSGLALTPGPVAAAIFAPFAGRLAQRIGPGLVGGAGAVTLIRHKRPAAG